MVAPTFNPTESTLKNGTRIPELRHLSRGKYRPRINVKLHKTLPKTNSSIPIIDNQEERLMNVSLSGQELKLLWSHFSREGLNDEQIKSQIELVKSNIRMAHQKYREDAKYNKSAFSEEFQKLKSIQVRR